jgi:AraC-like DNA-binding protein
MTPKALCRIHRFRGALAMLDGARQVPWAALSDQCGYYDQSHLINEFRSFSGLSPELVGTRRSQSVASARSVR